MENESQKIVAFLDFLGFSSMLLFDDKKRGKKEETKEETKEALKSFAEYYLEIMQNLILTKIPVDKDIHEELEEESKKNKGHSRRERIINNLKYVNINQM